MLPLACTTPRHIAWHDVTRTCLSGGRRCDTGLFMQQTVEEVGEHALTGGSAGLAGVKRLIVPIKASRERALIGRLQTARNHVTVREEQVRELYTASQPGQQLAR